MKNTFIILSSFAALILILTYLLCSAVGDMTLFKNLAAGFGIIAAIVGVSYLAGRLLSEKVGVVCLVALTVITDAILFQIDDEYGLGLIVLELAIVVWLFISALMGSIFR